MDTQGIINPNYFFPAELIIIIIIIIIINIDTLETKSERIFTVKLIIIFSKTFIYFNFIFQIKNVIIYYGRASAGCLCIHIRQKSNLIDSLMNFNISNF